MRGNSQEAMGPGAFQWARDFVLSTRRRVVGQTLGWLSIIVSSRDDEVFPRRSEVAAEVVACIATRHMMVRRLAR
jgi:hypothetical protein